MSFFVNYRAIPEAKGACGTFLSHEDTLDLIEAVRKQENLWNEYDENYNFSGLVQVSWNNIIDELFEKGCQDADLAIDTWFNLYEAYYNYLQEPVVMSANDQEYLNEMSRFVTGETHPEDGDLELTKSDFMDFPAIKKHYLYKKNPSMPKEAPQPNQYQPYSGFASAMMPTEGAYPYSTYKRSYDCPTFENSQSRTGMMPLPYGAPPGFPRATPPGYSSMYPTAPQAPSYEIYPQYPTLPESDYEAQATKPATPAQKLPAVQEPVSSGPTPSNPSNTGFFNPYLASNFHELLMASSMYHLSMPGQNKMTSQIPEVPVPQPLVLTSLVPTPVTLAPAPPVKSPKTPSASVVNPDQVSPSFIGIKSSAAPNHVSFGTNKPLVGESKKKGPSVEPIQDLEKLEISEQARILLQRVDALFIEKLRIQIDSKMKELNKNDEFSTLNTLIREKLQEIDYKISSHLMRITKRDCNLEEEKKVSMILEKETADVEKHMSTLKKMCENTEATKKKANPKTESSNVSAVNQKTQKLTTTVPTGPIKLLEAVPQAASAPAVPVKESDSLVANYAGIVFSRSENQNTGKVIKKTESTRSYIPTSYRNDTVLSTTKKRSDKIHFDPFVVTRRCNRKRARDPLSDKVVLHALYDHVIEQQIATNALSAEEYSEILEAISQDILNEDTNNELKQSTWQWQQQQYNFDRRKSDIFGKFPAFHGKLPIINDREKTTVALEQHPVIQQTGPTNLKVDWEKTSGVPAVGATTQKKTAPKAELSATEHFIIHIIAIFLVVFFYHYFTKN